MPKPRFFRSLLAAAVVLIAVPLLLGAGGSSGGLSDDLSPDLADLSEPAVSFAPKGHKVLPESKLLVDSALGIDLTNQSITIPLHKGEFRGKRVWYIITEASDFGVANGLDVNFSPKLVNMAVGCPRCVQEVTLKGPPKNKFGEAVVQFQGVPDFSPRRELVPGPAAGPGAFPPASATPGAVGDARYSPFIRIRGSSVIYNTAIVASGDGPFDVERHTNTADRVLSIKKPGPAEAGKFSTPTVEMLLVRGLEADETIFYLSTEASERTAATLERATFVPLLQGSAFLGGDDFLGAARERIFIFANGQSGADNPEAQGLAHLIADGRNAEDASLKNTELLKALRENDGDAQNVLGDFPSLADPRHANAYSPLWDAQIGEWTKKAVDAGLNKRLTDENRILNLAAKRPDLLTGPGGSPYGSVGFVINCPTVGFEDKAPKEAAVAPTPGGQF